MRSFSPHALLRFATVIAMIAAGGMAVDAIGHAVVVGTSLQRQPIHARAAGKVTLKFNSAIEVALSRVFLVSKGDIYRALSIAAGAKRGELVIDVPALAEGDYALKYRVFAADGHLTEDAIRFRASP